MQALKAQYDRDAAGREDQEEEARKSLLKQVPNCHNEAKLQSPQSFFLAFTHDLTD